MNKTSADKIKSATPFLIWFRRCLPDRLQNTVRPYLDQPYQLALNVLDCCSSPQPPLIADIAQLAGVTRETARQVLQALREGGMTFSGSSMQGWQSAALPFSEEGMAEGFSSEPTQTNFSRGSLGDFVVPPLEPASWAALNKS
jgi:hypothetical protein